MTMDSRTRDNTLFKRLIRNHYLLVLLIIVVTFIGLLGSNVSLWLRYDRNAILSGEVWRLVTGHLAHLSLSHLFLNLAGLIFIWVLFNKHLHPKQWLLVMLAGGFGISLGLLILHPGLRWYVGLSGVLHTLFVLGCLLDIQQQRKDAWFLLILVMIKLLWEQLKGPLPGSENMSGGPVVVDAHLFGAIMGFIIYFVVKRIRRQNLHSTAPQHHSAST